VSTVADLIRIATKRVGSAGLPSAQLAVARNGVVEAFETFGAGHDSAQPPLYSAFSTTKALVSSAVWLLLQDELLRLDERACDLVPGFGKDAVLVEHLLTHTAGFPQAAMPPELWADPDARRAHMGAWELQWDPGSRFVYHATSTMWVLAEIIEVRAGVDFREFIRARIIQPLGLTDLHLGPSAPVTDRVAPVEHVGRPLPGWVLRMLGVNLADVSGEAYFETYNQPAVRRVGVPSSGVVTTAADLTLFYQALLTGCAPDGRVIWAPETLASALEVRTGDLVDPMTGKQANRALGVVVAGGRDRMYRGFGKTCSARAFGHPGAGGQVAWADPETGLSFVFLTSGFDRNTVRLGLRMGALSKCAASVPGGP